MKTSKKGRKNKALRLIGITAAALTACGGAVFLFLKKKKRYHTAFMIAAVIMCGFMMGGITAYAAPEPDGIIAEAEPGTAIIENDTDAEPGGVIIPPAAEPEIKETETISTEETEIDLWEFLSLLSASGQKPLSPPGNLTLVDDYSGAQASDKQFITVTTKSGNIFYIIIDRAGDKENVHFLNLVDEADLLAILVKEKKDVPPPTTSPAPAQTATPTLDPTSTEPKSNNTMGLLIMTLVIAAIGGGAFYHFKVLKPKQGGGSKKSAGVSELDEFNFDPDEDDFIGNDTTEQDGGEYEGDTDMDEDMPDFTAEPESGNDE